MKLSELIKNTEYIEIVGEPEKEIVAISQDTREQYKEGTLYIAVKGTQVDGHDYVEQAIEKGAHAILCEFLPQQTREGVTYIVVKDAQYLVGLLASIFYGNPSEHLTVIGATGTNGKTTVAHAIYASLTHLGEQPLLLSTAGDFFHGIEISINRIATSSIEPIELHRVLAEYLKKGCTHVCLEVTSHALHQYRVNGVYFDVAIFTNLTQDHLDYHGTMEDYARSKKMFFDIIPEHTIAVINSDSEYGEYMIKDTLAEVTTYGENNADFVISDVHLSQEAQSFSINGSEMSSKQIGLFNAYNTTAAFVALSKLGYSEKAVIDALSQIDAPKGRLEIIPNKSRICAIVDYAHTPDALENVLKTLVELPHNNIITVFGCGGDRDAKKRPQMAHVAQKYSDLVVATSDNPRTENPEKILNDIEKVQTQDESSLQEAREKGAGKRRIKRLESRIRGANIAKEKVVSFQEGHAVGIVPPEALRPVTDIAETTRATHASQRLGLVGKGLTGVGLLLSATRIATAPTEDRERVIAEEIGAWSVGSAGAFAGAKLGASIGAFAGPVGAVIGGFVGGLVGGLGFGLLGADLGETVHRELLAPH